MSTNFVSRVRSGQQEPGRTAGRGLPVSHEYRLSMQKGGIGNPVTLIRTISKMGLGLKKAHDVVSRITDGETVGVALSEENGDVSATLVKFGVDVVRG